MQLSSITVAEDVNEEGEVVMMKLGQKQPGWMGEGG